MHRALLCSAPPKLQNTSKRSERDYSASCGASRKPNTRERAKERVKRFLGKRRKKTGKACKDMKREKEPELQSKLEQEIQKSLKEDLWFGKGVASASSELDLAGKVQYSTVLWRTVHKVMDEIGVKLLGLLSV